MKKKIRFKFLDDGKRDEAQFVTFRVSVCAWVERGYYVAFMLETTPQILCEKCAPESKFFTGEKEDFK